MPAGPSELVIGIPIFVVVVLALLASVYLTTKWGVRGLLWGWLGGLFVLPLLALLAWGLIRPPQPIANSVPAPPEDHPLEVLWEQLTLPQIDLSGKPATGAPDVKTLDATQAPEAQAPEPQITEPQAAQAVRPDWVDLPPKRVGHVYREVIRSGPYATLEECHLALEQELRRVVGHRLAQLTPLQYHQTPPLEQLGLGVGWGLRELARPPWVETIDSSVGAMQQVHLLLEFNTAADQQLVEGVRNYQRTARITGLASQAGWVVGALALLYGLLQADTATRGGYTWRLFLGVPAAIIGLVMLWR
jgi:hypothetical protein